MDSDVVLTKPVDASTFRTNGKPNFSRIEGALHGGMRRHILWHKAAREMLGLSSDVSPPLNDYVDCVQHLVPGHCEGALFEDFGEISVKPGKPSSQRTCTSPSASCTGSSLTKCLERRRQCAQLTACPATTIGTRCR